MSIPLLTYEHYSTFIAADDCEDEKMRKTQIKNAISLISEGNRKILEILCRYLHEVSSNKKTNKMGTNNLAIVFAPTLLWSSDRSPFAFISDSAHCASLIESLIDDTEFFFSNNKKSEDPELKEFQKKMYQTYTVHRNQSYKMFEAIKTSQKLNDQEFNDQISNITARIQSGDAKALEAFFRQDESPTPTPPPSPRHSPRDNVKERQVQPHGDTLAVPKKENERSRSRSAHRRAMVVESKLSYRKLPLNEIFDYLSKNPELISPLPESNVPSEKITSDSTEDEENKESTEDISESTEKES